MKCGLASLETLPYIKIPTVTEEASPCKWTLLFPMLHSLNVSPRGNTIPWIGMEGYGSFILTQSQALESSHKVRWATSQGFIAPCTRLSHSQAQNARPPHRTDNYRFGMRMSKCESFVGWHMMSKLLWSC